jgi:hypothetical protein
MGTFKIDTTKKTVTFFGQKTKTKDGHVVLNTTISYENADDNRLLFDAASHGLIAWRAGSGIKEMTTAEATKNFTNVIVDRSKTSERVKHVETEEEKQLKEILKNMLIDQNGKCMDMKTLLARMKELAAVNETPTKELEDLGEDALEAGMQALAAGIPTE